MFENECARKDLDPDQLLLEFVGKDEDPEDFWMKVKTNLQAGKIRMLFVADEIPSELQRIVEFLNEQMDPAEVLAVEIKQFTSHELQTLVPRVIGLTSEAKQKKATGLEARQWDEQSFFERLNDVQTKIARELLDWSNKNMTRIWWGKGIKDGSFTPIFEHNGRDFFAIAVRTGYKNPHIQIQFQPLSIRPPFDQEELRLELLERLNKIPGVNLPKNSISRYPSILFSRLEDELSLDKLIEAMEWFIQKVKEETPE